MAKKWHIANNGEVRKCLASKESCPFNTSHFKTSIEAQTFYENKIQKELNLPSKLNCDTYDTSGYAERSDQFVESLSTFEKAFIKDYIVQKHKKINESLWNDENDYFFQTVSNALSRNSGDPRSLWRAPAREYMRELVKNKKIGDVVEMKGYTSTSETPRSVMPMMITHTDNYMREVPEDEWEDTGFYEVKIPEEYLKKDPNIIFQFITSMGGEVSHAADYMRQEKETLLPAKTKWKIVGIKKNVEFFSSKDMFGKDSYKEENRFATVYQFMEI